PRGEEISGGNTNAADGNRAVVVRYSRPQYSVADERATRRGTWPGSDSNCRRRNDLRRRIVNHSNNLFAEGGIATPIGRRVGSDSCPNGKEVAGRDAAACDSD